MTGTELLTAACGLIDGMDASSYPAETTVAKINFILADTFELNNHVRAEGELALLATIPTISELTETLPYEDAVCKRVLPSGLVCRLISEDGDYAKLSYWEQIYADKKNRGDRRIATIKSY